MKMTVEIMKKVADLVTENGDGIFGGEVIENGRHGYPALVIEGDSFLLEYELLDEDEMRVFHNDWDMGDLVMSFVRNETMFLCAVMFNAGLLYKE